MSQTFGSDLEFLKNYSNVVVLSDGSGQVKVAVVPEWQGRVMTSTSGGEAGPSYGWINYDLIQSGELQPHINVFGGEDRFWMGPEGGQYAIFFQKGDPFEFQYWQTPAFIDTLPYEITSQSENEVGFEHQAVIRNYSDTEFSLKISRTVRLLSRNGVKELFGSDLTGLQIAAFETENTVTNTGANPWTREEGLLSVWILGMYNPTPRTTVVIPFKEGSEEELGPSVNDAYFGKISPDRLRIEEGVVFLKCDGESRGKIGISPARAKPFAGSWDAASKVLTIVQFNLPESPAEYVNSMWEVQDKPFAGDVVNSYNDGPPEPGAKPLGPFYELETSSPALALTSGESYTHFHRTVHLSGDFNALNRIAEALLDVGIQEIESAFRSR